MFISKSQTNAHCSPICRLPKFGYIIYEAFKLIYGSIYCDFDRLINAPTWARNIPFLMLDPDAPVLTTETLFNVLSGLASQLFALLLSVADIPGIGNGGDGDGGQAAVAPPGQLVGPPEL